MSKRFINLTYNIIADVALAQKYKKSDQFKNMIPVVFEIERTGVKNNLEASTLLWLPLVRCPAQEQQIVIYNNYRQ